MYLAFKLVHVAAVLLFLGNIITGFFWHAWAARTEDPTVLAHTMAGIIRSDRLFTVPGVIAIVASGITIANLAQRRFFARVGFCGQLSFSRFRGLPSRLRWHLCNDSCTCLRIALKTLTRLLTRNTEPWRFAGKSGARSH